VSVHEKIRFIRQAKNLSQDEMAEKLGICLNAYGNIERGDTDIRLSRLEQIAQLFEMPLSQLLGFDEKNVFNVTGTNNRGIHHQNYGTIHYLAEYIHLQNELEKEKLLNQQKDLEIELKDEKISDLNRIIELLEKPQV
jgi:transcriptional regulator with XRE-family HTH domain